MSDTAALEQQLDGFRTDYASLREQIGRVIVGQQAVVDETLAALLAGGHVLVEGAPGVGKTLLAQTLSDTLAVDFRRIQFTPDLMPADVIGTYVVMESHGQRKFEFQQGPLFANIVLIDEINRATPKTQAALLEALQEGVVTVANRTYELPDPFFVIATLSLTEIEGTFPLPETQLDRFFFKAKMPLPTADEMEVILDRTTEATRPVAERVVEGGRIVEMRQLVRQVAIAPQTRRTAIAAVMATHPDRPGATPLVRQFVRNGSSPRGAQAMILAAKIRAILEGRVHVAAEDLQRAALPALRHRLTLNFQGHAEQIDPDDVVREILSSLESPK